MLSQNYLSAPAQSAIFIPEPERSTGISCGVYTKPDTVTQLSKISKSDTSWKTRTQISKSDTFRRKRHSFQEIRHNSRKPDTPLGYCGLAVNAGTIGPLSSFLPPTFSPLRRHTMAGLEALLMRLRHGSGAVSG
jgi:hypothetical protein